MVFESIGNSYMFDMKYPENPHIPILLLNVHGSLKLKSENTVAKGRTQWECSFQF